jgi:ribosomal-protein-alanine N-acetyltransferase
MILRTARLVLRPALSQDHAVLHAMFTDPGVRRVIFDDQIISLQQSLDFARKSEWLFATEGFGLWTAATSDEVVGFGGLWYFREPPELELLYGVRDAQLKRGYGREIARGVIAYGFDVMHMNEIWASTDPAHADSRRLLEDLGFTFHRQAVAAGLETVFYRKRAGN